MRIWEGKQQEKSKQLAGRGKKGRSKKRFNSPDVFHEWLLGRLGRDEKKERNGPAVSRKSGRVENQAGKLRG